MKATNIEWDTNDKEWRDTITADLVNELMYNLPSEIEIPADMTDKDEISDYITNMTGFCHKGFKLIK